MKTITEAGGIIMPASPSFYSKPNNFEELAATVINRAIDLADLKKDNIKIKYVDLGGGMSIPYNFKEKIANFRKNLWEIAPYTPPALNFA